LSIKGLDIYFLEKTLMLSTIFTSNAAKSCPIHIVAVSAFDALIATLSPTAQGYIKAVGFSHEVGKTLLVPSETGALEVVILCDGAGVKHDPFLAGKLPSLLPEGVYHIVETHLSVDAFEQAILGFLLGAYKFTRYVNKSEIGCKLVESKSVNCKRLGIIADAVAFGRDLINTPTNDLGCAAFAKAALDLAKAHGAKASVIVGDELLKHNFPMVHAVGRASDDAPRLVDFSWGDESHPKVTLVGKSVCFDTGGLNIKPDSSMLLMKKDMGGGAITLSIAQMVMALELPVCLRVILPIAENSISSNAFRPGDVLASRKGLSVEIGNTDAEGRLILADAIALACEDAPEMLLDFATLTGAARVALGPELPPFYTDDDVLAHDIETAAFIANDPVWRLPLWNNYDAMLSSKIADVNHVSAGGFAGSITAALFLRRFVEKGISWCHFDTYAWTPSTKPAHPEGGEVQVARLVLSLLEKRYSK
jgi:leucyl aminopeptidase